MNGFNLKKIRKSVRLPMTPVMAQAWFLSTHCRYGGRGLLRETPEGLE
ncbi:MAG: hypothetical protein KTQ49_02165 [Candidatus Omnitrophica bacterium]|nr:hypothetical protein [Candidatus Omnitrophota bacterium]